jgi:hypothetical protein
VAGEEKDGAKGGGGGAGVAIGVEGDSGAAKQVGHGVV